MLIQSRAVELLKVKTARFAEIIKECGAPEVLTLWSDPERDKDFQRALRADRIMSVHQTVVGSKKDFGQVGFLKGPSMTYLLFPKSIARYAGRRVVGIDYALLRAPAHPVRIAEAAQKPRKEGSKPLKKAARKTVGSSGEDLQQIFAAFASERARSAKSERVTPPATPAAATRAATAAHARPTAPKALDPFMSAAIAEARKSAQQGGIPIGAALVRDGELLAVGHNKRVQENDPVTHAETDCLRNAGRLGSFRGCTLYSTLMPCYFCAGAAIQFGIRRVVVGEKRNFAGAESLLRSKRIKVLNLDVPECREMMAAFIRENPKLWNEDIGR